MKSKLLVVLGFLSSALAVVAQPSTFTYQGQLSSGGSAATGLFDFRFALYDAASLGNQVGSTITNAPVGVTNGLFTTELTFGAAVFDGNSRWLEISVRTNGTGAFTNLNPRQLLTATPYAVRAANYSGPLGSTNITGKINDTNLSVNVALLTNNAVFTRTVTASNFIGNGITLTNLSTTNLVGTIPDTRLSTNVAFLNATNAVFLGSVTGTNFYGEGRGLTNVPGRIFEFVPTAASVNPSYANYGYLATSDTSPVVVTLPPNEQLTNGNLIRIAGSGAAGWIVAQNTNQTILLGNLLNNVGVNWTTNVGSTTWKAITSSADGSRLAAVFTSGTMYISTNYGVTWSNRATVLGNLNWSSIASSGDGLKLVACVNGGFIYTSTDGGLIWNARATGLGAATWSSVASSLDGTRLVASSANLGVYTSTDSGVTWIQRIAAASWTGVAASANGLNLAVVANGQQIWLSTNAGTNWVQRESSRSWTCIASSSDGGVLIGGVNSVNNYLFVSTDYGATWKQGTIAAAWSGVACSTDGSRMIAAANGGGVYVSQDTGVTWELRNSLPSATYTCVTSSSDGSTLAAVANGTGIFISSKASTTMGATGQLIGSRLAAVELLYAGNGVFIPISYVGTIRAK